MKIVKQTLSGATVFTGLSSSFLGSLSPSSSFCGYRRSSTNFVLPKSNTPILIIATGTGIAPFRGFLQERKACAHLHNTFLYFGCKNEEQFLFREELEQYRKDGVIEEITVAFSETSGEYVQHKILEKKNTVWQLLRLQPKVYVCGKPEMIKEVYQTFVNIVEDCLPATGESEKYV